MKKFIAPLLVGAALSSAFAADDLAKEVAALKAQMAELKSAQSKINIDALRAQVSVKSKHTMQVITSSGRLILEQRMMLLIIR
jgi:hypothetical protein